MSIKIKINRLEETLRYLKALHQDTSPAIAAALEILAQFGLERGQLYSPVRTGFMKSNMQYYQEGELTYVVISEAYYSWWVEFGHLTIAGTFVSGQFFFTHALEDCQSLIENGEFAGYVLAELNASAG